MYVLKPRQKITLAVKSKMATNMKFKMATNTLPVLCSTLGSLWQLPIATAITTFDRSLLVTFEKQLSSFFGEKNNSRIQKQIPEQVAVPMKYLLVILREGLREYVLVLQWLLKSGGLRHLRMCTTGLPKGTSMVDVIRMFCNGGGFLSV